MTTTGFDCASPVTAVTAKSLASSGMKFVCRYLVPQQYAWKRLTREEAETITAAGMRIVSVFEAAANRVSGGSAAGSKDGEAAMKEAKAIGQPAGTAIYFAVDYDAQPSDYNAIEAYLKAAASEITGYETGVYASYAVIEEMARRRACTRMWQTYAWSKGRKSSAANIYQYKNEVTMAGIKIDLNESYGGEGWWDTMTVSATYPDVPGGHWAEAAITAVTAAGLMHGYPDGTFRPDQPMTRAETAAVVYELLKRLDVSKP